MILQVQHNLHNILLVRRLSLFLKINLTYKYRNITCKSSCLPSKESEGSSCFYLRIQLQSPTTVRKRGIQNQQSAVQSGKREGRGTDAKGLTGFAAGRLRKSAGFQVHTCICFPPNLGKIAYTLAAWHAVKQNRRLLLQEPWEAIAGRSTIQALCDERRKG